MAAGTARLIRDRGLAKGDVLEVARLAGIMASKRTGDLIPLCHPLPLESVTIDFEFPTETTLYIEATVRVTAKTGVEMEALTAAGIAALDGLRHVQGCGPGDADSAVATGREGRRQERTFPPRGALM